jgi:hypothetical protein
MLEFVESGAKFHTNALIATSSSFVVVALRRRLSKHPFEESLRILRQFRLDRINTVRITRRLGRTPVSSNIAQAFARTTSLVYATLIKHRI